jgi:hypothetical protein
VRATITDPSGASHDESGWYRLENGRASLPFRPALNDPPGRWKLTVVERTSGLKGECEVVVR